MGPSRRAILLGERVEAYPTLRMASLRVRERERDLPQEQCAELTPNKPKNSRNPGNAALPEPPPICGVGATKHPPRPSRQPESIPISNISPMTKGKCKLSQRSELMVKKPKTALNNPKNPRNVAPLAYRVRTPNTTAQEASTSASTPIPMSNILPINKKYKPELIGTKTKTATNPQNPSNVASLVYRERTPNATTKEASPSASIPTPISNISPITKGKCKLSCWLGLIGKKAKPATNPKNPRNVAPLVYGVTAPHATTKGASTSTSIPIPISNNLPYLKGNRNLSPRKKAEMNANAQNPINIASAWLPLYGIRSFDPSSIVLMEKKGPIIPLPPRRHRLPLPLGICIGKQQVKPTRLDFHRILIAVTILGSPGRLRFFVGNYDTVQKVVETALKVYAREGRLPTLGLDFRRFHLHQVNSDYQALDFSSQVGSLDKRQFLLCPNKDLTELATLTKGSATTQPPHTKWRKIIWTRVLPLGELVCNCMFFKNMC